MRKKVGWIAMAVVAILAIAGIVYLPKIKIGAELLAVFEGTMASEKQTMNLEIKANLGDSTLEMHPKMYVVKEGDKTVIVLEENERTFYLSDGAIYLENGKGFRLSEEASTSEFSAKQLRKVIKNTNVKKTKQEDSVLYTLTIAENISVEIVAQNGILQSIHLDGSVKETAFEATISEIRPLNDGEYALPENIAKIIKETEKDSLTIIGEEMYHLFLAWSSFKGDEKEGVVKLAVTCGLIDFEKELDWKKVANGLSGDENASNIEKMPEMLYEICMNSEIHFEKQGNQYLCQLEIDEEAMDKLAETLAPELKLQLVSFKTGEVEVVVENDEIKSFHILLNGGVKILFTEIGATVGAEFTFY